MVSHKEAGVTAVKNPAESFGEYISGIDNAGNVAHDEIAKHVPLVKSSSRVAVVIASRKTQSLSRLQLNLIPEEYDDVVSDLVAESSLT